MRAIVMSQHGGPEVLETRELPDPVPGPGEVRIEIAASAVNRADILQRQGVYPPPAGAPPYPGLECSGRIVELGAGVTGWSVGHVHWGGVRFSDLLATAGPQATGSWPCVSSHSISRDLSSKPAWSDPR